MKRLRIVDITMQLRNSLLASRAAFEQEVGANAELALPYLQPVLDQSLQMLVDRPRPSAWGAYLAVDFDQKVVVGTCAFKDQPNPVGDVEIAYYTFDPFEGEGYASAMVRELVNRARAAPEVLHVLAHTLPERNASCRVLEKNGFKPLGEVQDPEEGTLWRWAINTRM